MDSWRRFERMGASMRSTASIYSEETTHPRSTLRTRDAFYACAKSGVSTLQGELSMSAEDGSEFTQVRWHLRPAGDERRAPAMDEPDASAKPCGPPVGLFSTLPSLMGCCMWFANDDRARIVPTGSRACSSVSYKAHDICTPAASPWSLARPQEPGKARTWQYVPGRS